MSIKNNIKKLLLLSLALVAGAGLLVLLVAAINKKNHRNCTGVSVTIDGREGTIFLNKQDVLSIIAPDKSNPLRGRPLASFSLQKMETAIKQNCWVKDAQVFFDNNAVLRITVTERTPVARIFTVTGNSFYIDSSGKQLPLNSKMTVKLPVYSNFPVNSEILYGADSVLMEQIKQMSPFILANPFWMAQIGQVDITPARTFEMIPVIGKHIIAFGDGSDYFQKFHRLLLFYQQVGAVVGLDKYSVINVAYDKQVVATKKGTTAKIDSLRAIKSIQQLIEASMQSPADTVSTMVDNNIAANASPAPTLTILKDNKRNATVKDTLNKAALPLHPTLLKKQTQKRYTNSTHPLQKEPKAVMKKASG